MNFPRLRGRRRSGDAQRSRAAQPERAGGRHNGAELVGAVPMPTQTGWSELQALHDRLGQLMSRAWGEVGEGWCPAADVEETADAYRVEVELPGVKREDVSVQFGGGELTISGELKERERVGLLRTRMRPVGRFCYRVRLPAQVEDTGITAALTEGVLTVAVPKTPTARSRKIPITV